MADTFPETAVEAEWMLRSIFPPFNIDIPMPDNVPPPPPDPPAPEPRPLAAG